MDRAVNLALVLQIELLQLGKSGIRVASYLTDLVERLPLRRKLHSALVYAHARLEVDSTRAQCRGVTARRAVVGHPTVTGDSQSEGRADGSVD